MPNRERYSDDFTGKADESLRAILFSDDDGDNDRIRRMKRVLAKAINTELTAKQRNAIMLYYYEGMNMVQIAERLGITFQAVSRMISRGRLRLFRVLQYYL